MTDPEIEYQRLVTGNPGAVRSLAENLNFAAQKLTTARSEIEAAADVPVWTGSAVLGFAYRTDSLVMGVAGTRAMIVRARGALETAADAYDVCADHADFYIGFWRNRPPALTPAIEEMFARLVNARLLGVGRSYNQQLSAVAGVLTGDEVDLDELEGDTRKWVEDGLESNEDWLEGNDSSLGPMIPNTLATGDGRNLTPQGLGYDPGSGSLIQGYYGPDKNSGVALIDETTGKELGEFPLGDTYLDDQGKEQPSELGNPTHAGGVSVDGDNVYVTDHGKVFTYSLSQMQNSPSGTRLPQSAQPVELDGGSYSAVKDGKLYLGDFEKNELYEYTRNSKDEWVKTDTFSTPDNSQGVSVRDNEFVFSTSFGRHGDAALETQPFDGSPGQTYDLPTMSQGVVEVDGELITSYESGAEQFDHSTLGGSGWLWGVPDYKGLWANPYMTRTPLSDLGLEPLEVEPATLRNASRDLDEPASTLSSQASQIDGFTVSAGDLGQVPATYRLATAVNNLLDAGSESLRTGSSAVSQLGEALTSTAELYVGTDENVGGRFGGITGR